MISAGHGPKFQPVPGVGNGDIPGGEPSPKLFGHGLGVQKTLDTPAWCAGWLLLKTERKFPLNVLLADSGEQRVGSDSTPYLRWRENFLHLVALTKAFTEHFTNAFTKGGHQ